MASSVASMSAKPRDDLHRIDCALRRLTRDLKTMPAPAKKQTFVRVNVWLDDRLRVMRRLER